MKYDCGMKLRARKKRFFLKTASPSSASCGFTLFVLCVHVAHMRLTIIFVTLKYKSKIVIWQTQYLARWTDFLC